MIGVQVVGITKNNYNILATIDLSSYKSLKDLYEDVLALKKETFADNDRIIFIYSKQSKEILELINELLLAVDIPNFFTIFEPTDYYDHSSLDLSLGDKFCIYPWINLKIDPTGYISPCCAYNTVFKNRNNQMININETTIQDVYLGDTMQSLRNQFRKGQRPTECANCWKQEDAGITSMRQNGKHKLKDLYYKLDWLNDNITNLQLFDLSIGGTLCNLSCRICYSHVSIEVANKELSAGRLSKTKFIEIQKLSNWGNDDHVWEQLTALSPNIKFLDLHGGEPMMSKMQFKFLKNLISLGVAKNIKLDYSTNGTFYSDKFFDIWDQFKEVKLSISVDDLHERFEYQRNSADWKLVENNVKKFKNKISNTFSIDIFPTVNIQNIYYLPELLDWATSLGLHTQFNILEVPSQLSIDYLPLTARIGIIDKLSTHTHNTQIATLIDKLKNMTYDGTNQEFLDYTKKLDQERQQSFTITHTEIAKLMRYV